MPATSKNQLANLALSRIGAGRVSDFETESTPVARALRDLYEPTLEKVLRSHPWNFAIRREDLAASATAPNHGWDYAYPLPSTCVRFLDIWGDEDQYNPITEFAIEGRDILCNIEGGISVRYVSRDIPVAEFDPEFVDAFTLLLASRLAGPVAENLALAGTLLQEFEALGKPTAIATNAREDKSGENNSTSAMISRSGLVRARFTTTTTHWAPTS
jgi:hypothetical protein